MSLENNQEFYSYLQKKEGIRVSYYSDQTGYIHQNEILLKKSEEEMPNSYHSHQTDYIFSQENLREVFYSREAILKNSNAIKEDFKKDHSHNKKIPHTFHNIYFTSPEDPKEIKKSDMDSIINNAQKSKSVFPDREYILWTGNEALIPLTCSRLKEEGITIKHLHLSDLDHLNLELSISLDRHEFGKASDILRALLVQKHGGIYMDLDYRIYNKYLLKNLTETYTLYIGKDSPGKEYFGNAYIAAVANHPVLNKQVEIIERNFAIVAIKEKHGICKLKEILDVPNYIKYPASLFSDVITKTGPTTLTVAFYSSSNEEGYNDAGLDAGIIFSYPGIRADNLSTNITAELTEETFIFLEEDNPDRRSPQELVLGNDDYSGSWISPEYWKTIVYDDCG